MTRILTVLLIIACWGLVACIGNGGDDDDPAMPIPAPVPVPGPGPSPAPEPSSRVLFGLNFGPYVDGSNPDRGARVTESQLNDLLQTIQNDTEWVRTFGMSGGLDKAGPIARSLGLKVAVGAWLSRDLAANEREISALIAAGQSGEADMLIVGSEVLLRKDLDESQLLDYIERVQQAVTDLPVTYADTYKQLLTHPWVIDTVDIVLANYYPYWEGISIDHAVAAIHAWHQQLHTAAAGKQVIVSEAGWPSDGEQKGNAVPSLDNAAYFFLNFISWAEANRVDYFYFEAFDEPWKVTVEGSVGAHWGIRDRFGNLKQGMEVVFEGKTLADNWSGGDIPGGPGTPLIELSYAPPIGSFDDLRGRIHHVDPTIHRVAVYIYVSGWWTKPFFNAPLTTIQADGSWTTDITTGGSDHRATRIAAFLVPVGYGPPKMSGGRSLPEALYANAVADTIVDRQQ